VQDWQLQDAKNRFSEVVNRAREEVLRPLRVHGQPRRRCYFSAGIRRIDQTAHVVCGFSAERRAGCGALADDVVDAINDRGSRYRARRRLLMYLLDTCVVSEARRRTPQAVAWLRGAQSETLFLSVITAGEIMKA